MKKGPVSIMPTIAKIIFAEIIKDFFIPNNLENFTAGNCTTKEPL